MVAFGIPTRQMVSGAMVSNHPLSTNSYIYIPSWELIIPTVGITLKGSSNTELPLSDSLGGYTNERYIFN